MSLIDDLAEMDDTANSIPKHSQSRQSPSRATDQPAIRPQTPYRNFPANCLPTEIRDYVCRAADSIGCDRSLVALPVLSTLGAAIGASRLVEIKPGFLQPSILWTAMIAESGSGKSPAFNAALGPYYRIEQDLHEEHAEECERLRMTHENLPKADRSKPEPELPPLPRCAIGDVTVEALAPVLLHNPQGVLLASDELSGWLGSFNQYKSGAGSDRAHWLVLYDGQRLVIDRKTGLVKTIIVPRGIVSVTGGIQPGVLRRALSNDDFDSGLPARFALTMPPCLRFMESIPGRKQVGELATQLVRV